VLLTDLKNIWQFCSKGNLQQNTRFNFYIDAYLIVTKAQYTPSTATVDINITKQNPTLKLITQFAFLLSSVALKRGQFWHHNENIFVYEKYEVHSGCWETT